MNGNLLLALINVIFAAVWFADRHPWVGAIFAIIAGMNALAWSIAKTSQSG